MKMNERAAQIAPMLIICAQKKIILTYDDIYRATGMNRAGIGKALNYVKAVCEDKKIPPLSTIVVRKGDGEVGHDGINDDFQQNMAKVFNFDWYNIGFPIINTILEKEL